MGHSQAVLLIHFPFAARAAKVRSNGAFMAKRKSVAERRTERDERQAQMISRTQDRFEEMRLQLEELGRLLEKLPRDPPRSN
jgi:anti-sigma-K factor RskA